MTQRAAIQGALDAVRGRMPHVPFATAVHPNPNLQGIDPKNICNRGNNPDGGVQLELSATLREQLAEHASGPDDDLAKFALAIQGAIDSTIGL